MKITVYDHINDELIKKLKVINCDYIIHNIQLLLVLQETNKCKQRYHLLENNNEYAFICEYCLKLNIFTYSKLRLRYPVRIIGIPCSVGIPGFAVSSPQMLLEMYKYIRTFKGAVLVLNSYDVGDIEYFAKGNTLPTHVIDVCWNSIDEYLNCMRSGYRYRLKKALKNLKHIRIRQIDNSDFDDELYSLYLNVYSKSEYKLERLAKSYFEQFGDIITFSDDARPRGFIQTYHNKEERKLYFMFCGIDYSYDKVADLYYLVLYEIVRLGVELNCKQIDLGQTTTDTKTKFSARIQERFMYITHSNPLIRYLICNNIHHLSYNEAHVEHKVMKNEGDINENFTDKTKTT